MPADVLEIEARAAFSGFTLDVAQSLPLAGCTAVFGASGAGKSTLLRLIAGFLRPDSGRIAFRGETWCDTARGVDTPAQARRVGVVFQDGRLFPHLSVEGNLLYAERRSGAAKETRGLDEIVDAFDLSPLLARAPASLSGGERQRVALARALLTRPRLLLLDEPLSALDRRRKSDIIPYLDDLPARFGAPVIYVSHSVEEIVRLADRTVVLKDGRVDAAGSTAEVLNAYGFDADTDAGAETPASGAIVRGRIAEHDEARLLTGVRVGESMMSLPINRRKRPGEEVNIKIDARDVAIATGRPEGLSIRNILPAIITEIVAPTDSPFAEIAMDASGETLRAQVTKAAVEELGLEKGREVYALVKSASFSL